MAYDIGARVGIEGEKEFRSQIARINKDYKSMGDYLKTLDKSMELNGKSMESLSAKSSGLRQQLAMQEEKQKALADALEKVRAQYGDGSQQVMRYEGAILDVKNTIATLERELSDTDQELERMSEGLEDVGDAAEDADDKVLGFGDVVKAGVASGAILNAAEEIGEALLDLGRDAVAAAADMKAANAQFEQAFGELEGPARTALDEISDATGIAATRLQGAYTALYAFTKSVGGDSATALNISQRAMKAAADSAAYYDRTVEDATETLQSFLKGNYENDAALGIAATETTRNAKANELYAKSFKELSEAQKVDVLLSMVEAGNAASGALGAAARELADTEEEMDRLANGIEDVGDAAEDTDDKVLGFGDVLKANLASGAILDAVKDIGEALLDLGREAVTAAADMKAANAQFEQAFGDLEGPARTALDEISDATGIAATRLQGAYTALYAFTKSVGGDSATALNISQRAMKAAADSAAYYDRTVEDATETLQSFLKGNYENDAALGIAATETTRNAKANELYAKSFKELSEAQKVDVLLSMVEAGNAASGALGAAAREADEWTNVTGELNEAWRQILANMGNPILEGLTPIIRGITDALKGLTEQSYIDVLNQEVRDFQAGLAAAEQTLADSTAEISANSSIAQLYVDRLQELEAAGLSTAEAQQEYALTVQLLNDLMPELNLTIDEHTGLLDQDTGAIEDNIQSLKKQAEQQAKQAYYKSIIDEYAKAYETLASNQMRLIELEAEAEVLTDQLSAATQAYTEAQTEGTQAQNRARDALAQVTDQVVRNRLEQEELTAAIADATEKLAAEDARLNAAEAGFEELTAAEQESAAAAAEQAQAQAELEAAYAETLKAARESIDSQIGLFEELAEKNDWSTEKILENWEAQRKAFANYADNLQKAVDMGLDEALVQQLSDGSQQSMMILDALVSGTQEDIDQINASFRGLGEAKDAAATAMADVGQVVDEALDQMAENAEDAGGDIVAGAVRGIKNNIKQYEAVMRQLGERGQGSYMHTWEMNSPSRWMRDASDYIVDGGVLQVQDRIRDMERAMTELAHSGQVAYQRQLAADADRYPAVTAGAVGYTTNTINNHRSVSLGGVTVVVNAQQGQDTTALAYEVAHVLNTMYEQEANAIG